VIEEHHETSPDIVGKAELVDLDMSHDVDLMQIFRHFYPGSPEKDVARANSYMAHHFARWNDITMREWFTFLGLLYAGSLYVQKVRRTTVSSRRSFPNTPRRPRIQFTDSFTPRH
jgi:hypothetical protein